MQNFKLINLLLFPFFASISMCSVSNENMHKVVHPNGLQLELPQQLSIEKTANGFLIEPLNAQELRFASQITVNLNLNTEPEVTKKEWNDFKNINGQVVYFRVEEIDGGSGGNIYTLIAWKSISVVDGYIYLEQIAQAESRNQTDFSLGWAIIENADVLTSVRSLL